MFTKKIITVICFAMLVSIGFVACKKDAFSEKDAIAAQTALLQTKFDNERSLEQLRQSGATALAQLNYQLTLQINSRTALQNDSIQRAFQRFNDSVALATGRRADSISQLQQKRVDIIVTVRDIQNPNMAISGATVLLPTTIGTVLTATTNSNGLAVFPAANNVNVPPSVQAIVSLAGWSTAVSGFINRSVGTTGTATVNLWNIGNLRNTVTGTVSIEADLTNNSIENLSNQLITITNTFDGTQNFFTGVTNASGVYSIRLPDAGGPVGAFSFVPTTKDTTSTLMVNALLPGTDSIPSVVTIPATYTLVSFIANVNGNGTRPTTPAGFVPTSMRRFYAAVSTPDSLNRRFYSPLTFNSLGSDPLTAQTNYMVVSQFNPSTGTTWDANNNATANVTTVARFPIAAVPTTFGTFANLPVRFVDILNNSDNLFVRQPSLQVGVQLVNAIPIGNINYGNFGFQSLPSSTTGLGTNIFTIYPTRSTATGNLNGYLPTATALVQTSNPANSGINNFINVNRSHYNNTFSLPSIVGVTGGTTRTYNLTFGSGTLSQGVK